jgi:hypothetical protein
MTMETSGQRYVTVLFAKFCHKDTIRGDRLAKHVAYMVGTRNESVELYFSWKPWTLETTWNT